MTACKCCGLQTAESPEDQVIKAIQTIESNGYVVVAFTPDELKNVNQGLLADHITESAFSFISSYG